MADDSFSPSPEYSWPWRLRVSLDGEQPPGGTPCFPMDTLLNNTACTANFCIFLRQRQYAHIPRQDCPVVHLCLYRQWSTAACMRQCTYICQGNAAQSDPAVVVMQQLEATIAPFLSCICNQLNSAPRRWSKSFSAYPGSTIVVILE